MQIITNESEIKKKTIKSVFLSHKNLRLKIKKAYTHMKEPSID
jgi:hypothetical protein